MVAEESQETTTVLSVDEWDGHDQIKVSYEELFELYEPFGLVYNASSFD